MSSGSRICYKHFFIFQSAVFCAVGLGGWSWEFGFTKLYI